MRLLSETVEWLDAEGRQRGWSRADLIEAAVKAMRLRLERQRERARRRALGK